MLLHAISTFLRYSFIGLLLCLSHQLLAQSLSVDSLTDRAAQEIEALQSLPDSVAPHTIRPNAARDSLLQPLTATRDSVRTKLDSLSRPARAVADTLQQRYEAIQQKGQAVQDSVRALLPDEVRQLAGQDLPPVPALPSLPPASLGKPLPSLQQVSLPITERFASPQALDKLTTLKSNISSSLPSVPTSLQQGLSATRDLPATAEQQAGQLPGMQELQNQQQGLKQWQQSQTANPVSAYTAQASSYTNMEQIQQQMKQQAMQGAQQHFKEHSEAIQEGQQQLSKLKKKYKTVQSEQDRYERATSLKGEPWTARLLLGSYFQVYRQPSFQLDVSPFIGYRFNTRWSVALGGTYRVASWQLPQRNTIYGGRAFLESVIYKGFALHGEYERLRVPVTATVVSDEPTYRWQEGVLVGVSKSYTITQHISGTALLLHNFTKPSNQTAYPSRWNVRLGFFLSR